MQKSVLKKSVLQLLVALITLAPLAAFGQAAPGSITITTAPGSSYAVNDILRAEFTCTLGNGSDGKPYEPLEYYAASVSSAYSANLAHNENPLYGVTANLVATDPNATTHTYPCWYGEDMTPGTTSATERNPPTPAGFTGWHCAFPCKVSGSWTNAHFTITDAGGTVSSSSFSFTVSGQLSIPDAAKGRIGVSSADPRYFTYADGDAYLPIGETFNGGGGGSGYANLASVYGVSHARSLQRTWLSLAAGTFGLTGTNSTDQNNGIGDTSVGLTSEATHRGRYSYEVTYQGGNPQGSGGFSYSKPITQSEKYGVWAINEGAASSDVIGITCYGNYATTSALQTIPNDGAWHYITGTIGTTAAVGNNVVNPQLRFEVDTSGGSPNTSGHFDFDDLTIVPSTQTLVDAPGSAWDLLGGWGDFELQNTLQQWGTNGLDAYLQACRLNDANTLLEFFQKGEKTQTEINANGSNAVVQVNASGGGCWGGYTAAPTGGTPTGITDNGLETAVGLLRSQQARRFCAEFGCYYGQGILGICFANECDLSANTVINWGQEMFANQMRQVTPDAVPLMGVDSYSLITGIGYYAAVYEDPLLNFAQPHIAVDGTNGYSNYGVPFNQTANDWLVNGVNRYATGGVNGSGYVSYPQGGGSNPSYPGIVLPTFQLAGTYTIDAWFKTAADTNGAFSCTVNGSNRNTGLYIPYPSVTNFNTEITIPANGSPSWEHQTSTFTLASGDVPWQGNYGSNSHIALLNFFNNQTHGTVIYGPITITDPKGNVFWQAKFDEPLLDYGSGDAVSVWGEPYGTNLSGISSPTHPVIIGESEWYYPSNTLADSTHINGNYSSSAAASNQTFSGALGSINTDMGEYPIGQYVLRSACATLDPRYCTENNWFEQSQAIDDTTAASPFQILSSLVDGFGLANGQFAGIVTTQTGYVGPGEPFVIYGQANYRNASTGANQAATKAIFSALPLQMSSATIQSGNLSAHQYITGNGTVTISNMTPSHTFTVSVYDPTTGGLVNSFAETSNSSGQVGIRLTGIANGVVIKVQ